MQPIYQGEYGFNTEQVGLLYLGPGLGFIFCVWFIVPRIDTVYNKLSSRNGGKGRPEYRLPLANIGSIFVPISLFWFAWTVDYHAAWWVSILATFFYVSGPSHHLLAVLHLTVFIGYRPGHHPEYDYQLLYRLFRRIRRLCHCCWCSFQESDRGYSTFVCARAFRQARIRMVSTSLGRRSDRMLTSLQGHQRIWLSCASNSACSTHIFQIWRYDTRAICHSAVTSNKAGNAIKTSLPITINHPPGNRLTSKHHVDGCAKFCDNLPTLPTERRYRLPWYHQPFPWPLPFSVTS